MKAVLFIFKLSLAVAIIMYVVSIDGNMQLYWNGVQIDTTTTIFAFIVLIIFGAIWKMQSIFSYTYATVQKYMLGAKIKKLEKSLDVLAKNYGLIALADKNSFENTLPELLKILPKNTNIKNFLQAYILYMDKNPLNAIVAFKKLLDTELSSIAGTYIYKISTENNIYSDLDDLILQQRKNNTLASWGYEYLAMGAKTYDSAFAYITMGKTQTAMTNAEYDFMNAKLAVKYTRQDYVETVLNLWKKYNKKSYYIKDLRTIFLSIADSVSLKEFKGMERTLRNNKHHYGYYILSHIALHNSVYGLARDYAESAKEKGLCDREYYKIMAKIILKEHGKTPEYIVTLEKAVK